MAHYEPRLLYSIEGVKAYHIQNGEEQELTPSGPQTLSLLMVPTNSPFADLSSTLPQNEAAPADDFYLHLNLPPELDMPLPATTQIYHQPPRSYLIPRWELGPDNGVFLRIEFPAIGTGTHKVSQEDIDTFETILAQCTAFLERAQPPSGKSTPRPYNPADYKPGEGYVTAGSSSKPASHGQVVLVDEENGSVVGELTEGDMIVDDSKLKPGRKDPVEIQISEDGKRIEVRPVTEDYLNDSRHPAYAKSTLVQNAAAASRLIVTGSNYLSSVMVNQANTFTQKSKPSSKPMSFKPSTHTNARKINQFTTSAAGMSAKTVGSISKVIQNKVAGLAGHKDRPHKGYDKDGKPVEDYKPGLLNKSMMAFSTVVDGIEAGGRSLLANTSTAANTVVGHKYGPEAGDLSNELTSGIKNVGLVYIDVAGVSRRAIIKSVAKGMVVGKVRGGGTVIVGGGNGGDPAPLIPSDYKPQGVSNSASAGATAGQPEPGIIGFGNAAPSGVSSGVGEPLGSGGLQGQAYPPGTFPPDKKYG
ncbi:hypothetical protein EJ05DRAFT_475874 [Pseudovirgaria hyperparasitica]|uniref:Senescence domain-containing protein n=1 Tax=Pseudovirgaria hyperparasitica TaxID=470096 RepID=A0A6A6W9F1_9PEZI|nr:uncharacterized protein EJ05DRAFT_475874 [Pseudovirgaria hyperparasitica]KAF2758570.1 hypothetical protein EJ05DRAFT_475874 [Pseudovirgaria hyperparasitica]